MLFVLPALLLPLAARYNLCNFSCAEGGEQWLACRTEKCTPRLAEDACKDGSEALLSSAPEANSAAVATDGVAISGPRECEDAWGVQPVGSFSERCELCMALATEASSLWRLWQASGTLERDAPDEERRLCDAATAATNALLPTVRTCRMHDRACTSIVASARDVVCAETWALLKQGTSESATRLKQQQRCGELLTQRNGSGVDDALVCPVPRDVGARCMAITAVVGSLIFAAQWARV